MGLGSSMCQTQVMFGLGVLLGPSAGLATFAKPLHWVWHTLPDPCTRCGSTRPMRLVWNTLLCVRFGSARSIWCMGLERAMSFGSGVSRIQQSLGPGHCQTYQLLGLDLTRPNNTWVCLVSHLARLHEDMYVSPTRLKCKKLIPVYFSWSSFFQKRYIKIYLYNLGSLLCN